MTTSPQRIANLTQDVIARRGRSLTGAALAELADRFAAAVQDYQTRKRLTPKEPGTRAALFADDLEAALHHVIAIIEKRVDAVTRRDQARRIRVVPVAPETIFVHETLKWLPQLKQQRAKARSEGNRWRASRGRPRDEARIRLECAIADALERAGIQPTKAKNGTFAQILREVIYPAVNLDARDCEHAIRVAIDTLPEWRQLPEWEQSHPRSREKSTQKS